jgi:pyruvate formate lyase activating enzyme
MVEFYGRMDAANVDLKGFTNDFYVKYCSGQLQPVLDTLVHLKRNTGTWFELTTLLIPTLNDSEAEIRSLAEWVGKELGPDVPLHFTAFHPDWKMRDIPPTPPATLSRARAIAREAGLHYVYTGNVHDREGGTTFCPKCNAELVARDWYEIPAYHLTDDGHCPHCGTAIAGRYERFARPFGARRMPISMSMTA